MMGEQVAVWLLHALLFSAFLSLTFSVEPDGGPKGTLLPRIPVHTGSLCLIPCSLGPAQRVSDKVPSVRTGREAGHKVL
jgi:hypothetical protein